MKSGCKALDVGAGTGLLGLKLGQKNIELQYSACDASSQFVGVLNAHPKYCEAREVWLGRGTENFPADWTNAFDLVTASGVWLKAHFPAVSIDDCFVSLKLGGYMVTSMRSMYWEHGNEEGFREQFDKYINAGRLEVVTSFTFMRGVEGEVGLFKPLESTLLCFKKIAE